MTILQHIGARSPPDKSKTTRQATLETAFARVSHRSLSKDASSTPSLTTGTSQTDNSSEVNDEGLRLEGNRRTSNRFRLSMGSYNEQFLSGRSTSVKQAARLSSTRVASGATTLVNERLNSNEELVEHHLQISDDDIKARPTSRGQTQQFVSQKPSFIQRASARPGLLQKASDVMTKAKTTLGKRMRSNVDDDEHQEVALYGLKSSRLRSREVKPMPPPVQGPVQKKARLSKSATKSVSPAPATKPPVIKKPKKIWLSQGLYVGQERDFDAKLTESENKTKISRGGVSTAPHKPFLPLPMFAGQRLLERGRNFKLPFNVFSPLPPGQPKPNEWKKTQKSMCCEVSSLCLD